MSNGNIDISVYATALFENAQISLTGKTGTYFSETKDISPDKVFKVSYKMEKGDSETDLLLTVKDSDGKELVSYRPLKKTNEEIPEPAKAIPAPEDVENNEGLYLAGLHLEQYRHATYEPENYYLEGLKRDPGDIRINNAYGLLLFRRGQFVKSEEYFRRAVKTATRHNTNSYDSEPLYNLGLCLQMQGKYDEAYDAFYKACWSVAMQDCGYFSMAKIAAMKGQFKLAIEHADKSIIRNYHNYKARNLKTALLRKLNQFEQAEKLAMETMELDKGDFGSRYELYKIYVELGNISKAESILADLLKLLRLSTNNYIELSLDYADAGMSPEAIEILKQLIAEYPADQELSPMVLYYTGWFYERAGNMASAHEYYKKGQEACPDYCFPNKPEDIIVFNCAIRANQKDSRALYYLGNLWYDKKQYAEAVKCWEKSRELDDSYPTVHRNLSLAYYNKLHDSVKARESLEKAFELNTGDSRVFLELDQLYKKLGITPEKRLENFEKHKELVENRDDLYVEYITLLNLLGNFEKARELTLKRQFHPWEGGEGKITKQYVTSHIEIGKKYLSDKKYQAAIDLLKAAETYPHNLGEGKLFGAQENNLNYYLGCAYEELGELEKAREYYMKASVGLDEPASAMFYNDQPPEMIFYQGLALQKLGEAEKAISKFNKLIAYGEKHLL
ncbi:MAG TPA: tetratricopeptide repeat protein, partial [Ruminiclostridium sp.]|nr:tetratricopeptide repeat protein [Ruminiclostridium sp.]